MRRDAPRCNETRQNAPRSGRDAPRSGEAPLPHLADVVAAKERLKGRVLAEGERLPLQLAQRDRRKCDLERLRGERGQRRRQPEEQLAPSRAVDHTLTPRDPPSSPRSTRKELRAALRGRASSPTRSRARAQRLAAARRSAILNLAPISGDSQRLSRGGRSSPPSAP